MSPGEVQSTLRALVARLLDRRIRDGHWEGHLAGSALSTATAIVALSAAVQDTPSAQEEIQRGLDWLVQHQNSDGGWGDTVLNLSNISTTSLCWSAFFLAHAEARFTPSVTAAEAWLRRAAGGLEPGVLSAAIRRRYGRDQTFSVPILTVLALAGRLGDADRAWRLVPQLPFELAACPQSWFRWLRLPLVSYALPALIAMGLARHRRVPAANPVARLVRNATRQRTLRILEKIQPSSGGFLEAVPLTSFVVLSLVAAGQGGHGVVRQGVEFLRHAARSDGSWPIDTNLATWVTTLSVNALACQKQILAGIPAQERARIRRWLLNQQYRSLHTYTGAAPGGWAWTDLPGGVPDADDTAGTLIALMNLGPVDEELRRAATAGIRWLLDLQNRDGGIPTFCRGWGWLPFDRSGPDLTAHALQAWSQWREFMPFAMQARIDGGVRAALRYLAETQRSDGSWAPLWFGNQFAPDEENPTYGTARVLLALANETFATEAVHRMAANGIGWLLAAQNSDGGWGGAADVASSIEETALAVEALSACVRWPEPQSDRSAALVRGTDWLIEATHGGTVLTPSPIGFYFARLWYFEELYPLIFATSAMARTITSDPRAPTLG